MSTQREFASLLPEDSDVSAYLDGVEATITSCRSGMFDYAGTRDAVPAIVVQYHAESMEKQPNPQNYTVGKPEHRVPSEDGSRFKVFGKAGLPKDSNGRKFIDSIINAGFPKDKLTDDLTIFEGMKVITRAEAQEKRDAGAKDRTVILVDKIVTLPWDNKDAGKVKAAATAGAKKTATAPKTAAPAAAAGSADPLKDTDAINAATEAVTTLLADAKNNGKIEKAKLGTLSFRVLNTNPNRLNATKLLSQLASSFLPMIVGAPVQRGDELVGTVGYDAEKAVVTLVTE